MLINFPTLYLGTLRSLLRSRKHHRTSVRAGRRRHVIVSSRGRSEACRQRVHSVARATLSPRISRGAMCWSAGWGLVQYPLLILGSVHPKPPPLGSGAPRAGGLSSFCTDAEPRGDRKVLQRGPAASRLGAVLQSCQATRGGSTTETPQGAPHPRTAPLHWPPGGRPRPFPYSAPL